MWVVFLISIWIRDDGLGSLEISQAHPSPGCLGVGDVQAYGVTCRCSSGRLTFPLVKKDRNLLLRDIGVEDGEIQFVFNLYLNEDALLHQMYESFHAFFIYL